jgi:hypothetical protein
MQKGKIARVELFDFSQPESRGLLKGFTVIKKKALVVLAALAMFSIVGSTLAANINLNGSAPVEFGQGVAQASQ